jgi:hypothetical protein
LAGRKVFTAGEVLQAADVNDFLMDQSVMVFAGTAARGSAIPSPSEGMVTYLSDSDEVEVFDGSVYKAVGPGKILQVVSTTKTDTFSTSSSSYTAVTGLTASITPSSASNKILVSAYITMSQTVSLAAGNGGAFSRLVRDSTPIFVGDSSGSTVSASAATIVRGAGDMFASTITFLDSPATTSSVTYGVEGRIGLGGTVRYGFSGAESDNANYGRVPCSITLMEVAG